MDMIGKTLVIDQTDHQVVDRRHNPGHSFDRHTDMVFLKRNIAAVLTVRFTLKNSKNHGSLA
jgi:hypothetical protein